MNQSRTRAAEKKPHAKVAPPGWKAKIRFLFQFVGDGCEAVDYSAGIGKYAERTCNWAALARAGDRIEGQGGLGLWKQKGNK